MTKGKARRRMLMIAEPAHPGPMSRRHELCANARALLQVLVHESNEVGTDKDVEDAAIENMVRFLAEAALAIDAIDVPNFNRMMSALGIGGK